MSDDDLPETSKLTRSKRLWARQRRQFKKRGPEAGDPRLPPGQHRVEDWPVLDLGQQPSVGESQWRLDVRGLVENPVTFDWAAFMKLPQTGVRSDIHCVTSWSRFDNDWKGVSTDDLLAAVEPKPEAAFVMLTGYDGYTTNLPMEDFAVPEALLAHTWQGQPITRAHGGPMRLVVPHLYFWKSAKWLSRVDFMAADTAGFWEVNGYHMRGDPWAEERYSS